MTGGGGVEKGLVPVRGGGWGGADVHRVSSA